MSNNVPTPDPVARLTAALDPHDDTDRGLVVVLAHELDADAVTVLAELVETRVRREVSAAYERGWAEAGRLP